MMAIVNRQITLASRPVGFPKISDFHLIYSPLPSPAPGEVLVRTIYLSLDPYMRARMSATETYARSLAIGEVMVGGSVAIVMGSRDPKFLVGDAVVGMLGWQEYAAIQGSELRKIEPNHVPIATSLGVLGMPGLTAYFGLLDITNPQPGETVVVSDAAGAIGMVVGQIAKIKGCRVVGIAGSDAKIEWLSDELDFDAAFNYKKATDCFIKLKELCPAGIDVYFDNVGGFVTEAVMRLINVNARISVCGQISQYNLDKPKLGPRWLGQLIIKQAKVQGFLVSSYTKQFPEGIKQLTRWLHNGKIKYREDIAQGIEAAPQAFISMLQGINQGKQLVQISELSPAA